MPTRKFSVCHPTRCRKFPTAWVRFDEDFQSRGPRNRRERRPVRHPMSKTTEAVAFRVSGCFQTESGERLVTDERFIERFMQPAVRASRNLEDAFTHERIDEAQHRRIRHG